MERPGEKLKQVRERLKLTYRDVEKASQQVAARRASDEFADRPQPPGGYREQRYGSHHFPPLFAVRHLPAESGRGVGLVRRSAWDASCGSLLTPLNETHAVEFRPAASFTVPQPLDSEIDLNSTTFLSHLIRRWGKTGLSFLNGWDLRQHRYGFIGLEDWSMYPVLRPGSLVLIDESKRRIATDGWTNELDRPIYFLLHREGYRCGWCTLYDDQILVQPHPSSHQKPVLYDACGD